MMSSGSFDESRFLPGTVLAGRYRIVGVVGRGGMGEVYRADDLKLGQAVALKFLPEGLERDPSRLSRLFNEVSTARQVTHPNVCRVHDTGEFEGQHFISMEYVDGEDLRSLLRRIGRLPREKAVQIARQLCAGLAAAHEEGILHRDLKPANVMVDGRGRVRITDFGLAGLAARFEGEEVRAGTPSYMAPEQLAGKQVSTRSDVYALGLVLYELFTGKQAYEARSPDELRRMQETTPTTPSSFLDGFDPAVERVILRCLEPDPRQRPASALAVAAALPGGDPLAEALAAGETPSPEMVAEAGGEGGVRPALAVTALAVIIMGLIGAVVLRDVDSMFRHLAMDKPPDALTLEAREILAEVGHEGVRADSAFGFRIDEDYFEDVEKRDRSPGRWDRLAKVRPAPLTFWYRQSPRILIPTNIFSASTLVKFDQPPADVSGMASVRMDVAGRLLYLAIVPPQRDASEGPWPGPDWTPLLERSGLDPATLEPATPEWNPPSVCDVRSAWSARYPGQNDVPIRVEAAAYRGKPVYFTVVTPWTKADRMEPDSLTVGQNVGWGMLVVVLFGLLITGLMLARRNLRLGRGDRRGAFRLATFVFAVEFLRWVVAGHHVPRFAEVGLVFHHVAWALLFAGLAWVCYVALEPHVRRLWPDLIISWTRLLAGRYRDPLVGRAILAGSLCFVLSELWAIFWWHVPRWVGQAAPRPLHSGVRALDGLRATAGEYLQQLSGSIYFPIMFLFLLLLLRVLLRRQWVATAAFIAIMVLFMVLANPSHDPLIMGMLGLGIWSLTVVCLVRFGMLALVVWFVFNLMDSLPATTDLSAWYAGRVWLAAGVFAALACYGFWISLAGRPLFAGDLLPAEPEASK
jgi:serine/threonine-protein kinase